MPKRKTPYRSKIKIGVDADGRDILKYYQGYTKEELNANREQLIKYYITGEALEDDRMFGEYACAWYETWKKPFVSPSSQESYRSALNRNILPAFGDRKLRAISAMELQTFLNSFAGMSATKITVILATLRGIFGAAKADRLIRTDPTESLTRPKAAPPREKETLPTDKRAAVIEQCAAHPYGHYLALMYYLGVRPGEARGLQWCDIDFDRNLVHIRRDIDYKDHGRAGELKTSKSKRVVPLPAPLRDILWPLRGLPGCYIAAGDSPDRPLAKTSGERIWVHMMLACGLARPLTDEERIASKYRACDIRSEYTALITPHALRHNYATLCWEHGIDPYKTMKLMGHASIKTTMDIYTHLSEAQLGQTAQEVNDMFSPARENQCNFSATRGTF